MLWLTGLARRTQCLCSVIGLNPRRMSSPLSSLLVVPLSDREKKLSKTCERGDINNLSPCGHYCLYITNGSAVVYHILCQVSHK